ncbi:pyruvate kinase 1, cytosolic-like [Carex rostrata]
MQSGHMLIEEPVRLASVLTPTKTKFFPSLTKIVATLGAKSRSVETLEQCLKAGMSVARFDFSSMDAAYHQETLNNLRKAVDNVKQLCAVMLDTVGPELQVKNPTGEPIVLDAGNRVTITPDLSKATSAEIFPLNFDCLAKAVKAGDTIFMGQYLFTGSETTSVWLEVLETSGQDVVCEIKNTATLAGPIFTLHAAQVRIDLPTLSETDKQIISTWGMDNKVDIISLSFTRHAEDIRELRAFLKSHKLDDTQIFAKVEDFEGLEHFDEILQEADGIILSRGDLGIDLPPEDVFLFQKSAMRRCNCAGKPAIITRVVDSMVNNLRPTRAEATDVANAVLDGTDGILLGAETLRGPYAVDAIKTVSRICGEAETVYNQPQDFKRILRSVAEPMENLESVASTAVRAAIKVKAAAIITYTTSGRSARLIAKYRPTMPVLAVVFPRNESDSSSWTINGIGKARQCLSLRAVYPVPTNPNDVGATSEAALKLALDYGKSINILKDCDRVVLFQKIGDSSVVEIVDIGDVV